MRQANLPLANLKPLPSVQLIHGDCLEVMPTLPASSVQMVFADLPYDVLSWTSWDRPVSLSAFWRHVNLLACKSTAFCLTANMKFAARIIASNPALFRYDLVWQKSSASNPFLAKKRPLCTHENILVFSAAQTTYNPQMRPESERIAPEKRNRVGATQKDKFFQTNMTRISRMCGPLYPNSVLTRLTENKFAKNRHPTQKPIALLEWLIRTYTNEGDTVLDPVFGSATTAIACLRTGRNFVGIEKDAEYFRIGSERVRAEQERLSQL